MSAGWSQRDAVAMQAAIVQAELAAAAGEVPVGAVATIGTRIVASGHNRTIMDSDPSAHAEIVTLRAAGKVSCSHRLTDLTLYVTLEPCAMCVGALAQARITRLVFGAYDPKAGAAGTVADLTHSKLLNHRFEVNGGVLADECGVLLKRFFAAKRGSG